MDKPIPGHVRPTPQGKQCQVGFSSLLLARAHRRSRYPGRVHIAQRCCRGGRRGGRRRVISALPAGVGRERRAGASFLATDRTTSSGPPRPAGGFENGPPGTTLPAWSRPVGALPGEMHHLNAGAGGGGRARVPQARLCRRRRCRSSRGRDPALGAERAGSQRHKGGASAGAPGAQIHRYPRGSRSLAPRPPPTPGPARRGPPPSFPSRPPLLLLRAQPARGRLASASGLRPQTSAAALGTRGQAPAPPGPGSPRPGSLSGPCNPRGPPSPLSAPLGLPLALRTRHPSPLHRLSHSPGRLVWVPRERRSAPPAPGRRLRRHRARCRSHRGRSPATPRVRAGVVRRPSRSRPRLREPGSQRRPPAAALIRGAPSGLRARQAPRRAPTLRGAILRWAPEPLRCPAKGLTGCASVSLAQPMWSAQSGRRPFAPCPRGASSPGGR